MCVSTINIYSTYIYVYMYTHIYIHHLLFVVWGPIKYAGCIIS